MKNTTFRRFSKVSREADDGDKAAVQDVYTSRRSDFQSPALELQCGRPGDVYNYKSLAYSGGTLPRSFKNQAPPLKWKSLTQASEPQRKILILEKAEREAFGFEIQTYGVHHQNDNAVEMCTFVCRVHENSSAHAAGLKVGDTIAYVNDANVEGFRHREIVELIRSSGNTIRLETVYSASIRKAELQTRLQYLKQTLHEKWDEYRSLMIQEQRLVRGIVMTDPTLYDTLESVRACIYGTVGGSARSLSSTSSTADELDEPLYQSCVFDGLKDSAEALPTPSSSSSSSSSPARDLLAPPKCTLTRSASTRSYQNGGAARSWDRTAGHGVGTGTGSSSYGSLPRKTKQKSLRKRLLKFIPGLNRSLEEEESKL
ncbi:general receptor for phosphoinositides 1-associated scaffold protein [Erpetoichthys calabaricus]|uniref:Trafficking regulator and scaffold protein tamalin n=1 Tax=Erpetoichthys calabaricus TaxID=27687 RepID=A0A8C4XA46_ERPCA|nr:general receptor for phosphoinositides 1-associated scaffold protein [Erpetoichthys calabaricus]